MTEEAMFLIDPKISRDVRRDGTHCRNENVRKKDDPYYGRVWKRLPTGELVVIDSTGTVEVGFDNEFVSDGYTGRHINLRPFDGSRRTFQPMTSLRKLKRAARKVDLYWKSPGVTKAQRRHAHRQLAIGQYDWA